MQERLLERDVEEKLRDAALCYGGASYKFTSPARRNVPDRLVIMRPIPPEVQPIIARYVRFVELKAPGKKPTSGQLREHSRLTALGMRVDVVDSIEGVLALWGGGG